jgi:hypothetical protein
MSKNTTRPVNNGAEARNRYNPPQFIKRRLTDKELEAAKAAADTYSDVGEIFGQMIDEGYKVSASHDGWGGGVQVFMTTGDADSENYGYTLSARGPNLIAAVAVMCYKHYTLFLTRWPKEDDGNKGPNWG